MTRPEPAGVGTADEYLCLSIRQPWVWAIFFAGKTIENRDWATKVRGRVLIHAAKGMTRAEYEDAWDDMHAIRRAQPLPLPVTLPDFETLPRGCIFGGVTLVDCVTHSGSPWFSGPYGFALTDPKPLAAPIPYKGRLGFFSVPRAVLSAAYFAQNANA